MLYLSPPGPAGGPVRAAMAAGRLDAITTRVNTARRIDYARALGCASVDATTLAVSAGNLAALLRWLDTSHAAATDGSLFDVFAATG